MGSFSDKHLAGNAWQSRPQAEAAGEIGRAEEALFLVAPVCDFHLTDEQMERALGDLLAHDARRAWLYACNKKGVVGVPEHDVHNARVGVRVITAERGGWARVRVVGLHHKKQRPGVRGVITEWSARSRQALADKASTISSRIKFSRFVTLTFPREWITDGRIVKDIFKRWLKLCGRKIGRYLWFLEFQTRGAPHFHIMSEGTMGKKELVLWCQLVRWYMGAGDTRRGASMFKDMVKVHLHPKSCQAVRSADAGGRYAVKYAYKMHQKKVPEGYAYVGRFWGMSRGMCSVLAYHLPASAWDELRCRLWVAGEAQAEAAEGGEGRAPACLLGQKSTSKKGGWWFLLTEAAIFARCRLFGEVANALEDELNRRGARLRGQLWRSRLTT